MRYHQFCPISKAMEVLGEKWTFLIIREILLGSTRFNQLQRGLSHISPSLLTKRLAQLEEESLIVRKRIPGQRGYEYFPTEACKELFPVMEQIGIWGMRWLRNKMQDDDFDLQLLMFYLEQSIDTKQLVGKETVIKFNFTDVQDYAQWWLVVEGDEIDVCVHDPGKEVDIHLTCTLRTMCELFIGDITYKKAIAEKKLVLVGHPALKKSIDRWIKPGMFAGIPPANKILESA